ncbi:hypothetical protein PENTCL1PPCAC_8613, partial [Pristionchus entomophagus]
EIVLTGPQSFSPSVNHMEQNEQSFFERFSKFDELEKCQEDLQNHISKLSVTGKHFYEMLARNALDEDLATIQEERDGVIKKFIDVCMMVEERIAFLMTAKEILEDNITSDEIKKIVEKITNDLGFLFNIYYSYFFVNWFDDSIEQLRALLSRALQVFRIKKYCDGSELSAGGKCSPSLESLMEKAKQLLQDKYAIPNEFTVIAGRLMEEIAKARSSRDAERTTKSLSQHLLGRRLTYKLSEGEHLVSQLKERFETWTKFRDSRSDANQLLIELRTSLHEQLTKNYRSPSDAIVDLDAAGICRQNISLLRDLTDYLRQLSIKLRPLDCPQAHVEFLQEYADFLSIQAKTFVEGIRADITDKQAIYDSVTQISEDLKSLKNRISLDAGENVLESIRDHHLPIVEAHIDSIRGKIRTALKAPRKFITCDYTQLTALEQQFQDCQTALFESLERAFGNIIGETAVRLRKYTEETPIGEVPFENLDSIEKQLIRINSVNARNQVKEIDKLRDKMVDTFQSEFLKKFKPTKIIGQGSFGCVFQAEFKQIEMPYAVKRIPLKGSDAAVQKALIEVKSLASFDHPGIVRYNHSWIEVPPAGWLVSI